MAIFISSGNPKARAQEWLTPWLCPELEEGRPSSIQKICVSAVGVGWKGKGLLLSVLPPHFLYRSLRKIGRRRRLMEIIHPSQRHGKGQTEVLYMLYCTEIIWSKQIFYTWFFWNCHSRILPDSSVAHCYTIPSAQPFALPLSSNEWLCTYLNRNALVLRFASFSYFWNTHLGIILFSFS